MHLPRQLLWIGYVIGTGASRQRFDATEKVLGFGKAESPYVKPLKNYAAVIPAEKSQLKVAEVPFPKVGDDELIIRNYVVAVNPVDWKIQSSNSFNMTYPTILGEDVAGVVIEVGLNLKDKFSIGQRVIAHTLGHAKGSAYGGFQLYPILLAATTSLIPDGVTFTEAAVLPLSISTAAAGLFLSTTLALGYPKTDSSFPKSSANTKDLPVLLLWGGSSSVGSSVIQFAAAAGYSVVTTASPSNFEYAKELGATHVLDYHNPNVIAELIDLLKGENVVGAYDAIGSDETVRQNAAVLHALGGGKVASVGLAPTDIYNDVTVSRIGSGNIVFEEPEVAEEVWGKYVPWALKSGRLVPNPKALIVGKGLSEVQIGLDRQKQGVSARKVEVVLEWA